MNTKQKIVVLIAAIALAWSLLYVPWVTISPMETAEGHWVQTNYENRLFNNPPEDNWGIKAPYIAWRYPIQKAGVVLAVNVLMFCLFRTKRKQTLSAFLTQPTSPRAAF